MAWNGTSVVAHRILSPAETAALLAEIARASEQLGRRAICVFDLDSTLLDNRPRQSRILVEYGERHKVAELVRNRPEHWAGWDARIAMRNSGLGEAQVREHTAPFREYWRERFFTSEYCELDDAIAGAAEFVGALAQHCTIAYVTGRHEPMRAGSEHSLARLAFPRPGDDHVVLLMKPSFEETDDDYKLKVITDLMRRGEPIAAFDNEPAHINGYADAFPTARCVHLATDHSLRDIRVTEGIPSIVDFAPFRLAM